MANAKRLTIVTDRELEDALRAEQRRLAHELALEASLSSVAAMAIRRGLRVPADADQG